MFLNKINIRWSDLDPNQHLANSAYMNFMSATRMVYMVKQGVSYNDLKRNKLGPVVLREYIHYFKEVFPGEPVWVSQEICGLSENGEFYSIRHNFYNKKGENFARGEMMGTWISMENRKIVSPPAALFEKLMGSNRTKDFRTITKEETRLADVQPADVDLEKGLGYE